MNKMILVIVLSFIFFTSKAQIVNEGVLTITSGTSIHFKNDFTNKTGASLTNNGNLYLVGNFTNNGAMSVPTFGTTTFNGSTTDIQTIDGTSEAVHFYDLTVNNTHASVKGLAIADQFNVQVENDLHLTSGDLRLMGEAQFIQKHTGVSANTGNGHLLKDQDGAENAYRYNYWSSPVQVSSGDNIVANFLKDGTTPNLWDPATPSFIAGYDGTNGSPIGLAAFWFYKYVSGEVDPNGATQGEWINLFTGTTPNTGTSIMLPGEGYTMKGTNIAASYVDAQNYTFKGKPNDGDYSLNIAANKEYLVGNPYPSALDANVFIDTNTTDLGAGNEVIDGTLYFWHHWGADTHYYANYSAGYATYTKTGGTASVLHPDFAGNTNPGALAITPQQFIPVGQGFLVRSETTSGGTVRFNNSQRVFMLEGATSIPVKNKKATNSVTARIRLDYEAPNGRLRHLLLGYTDAANDALNLGWDGQMIDLCPDDLYFSIGETDEELAIPYVIQGIGAYDIDASYPLVVKTATSGKHTIRIDELENFDEALYILDEKENTHDLREGSYEFYTGTNETQRNLKLVFKPTSSPTDVQDNLNDFIDAYYIKDEIIIRNDQDLTLTSLQVYNAIGQLVLQVNSKNRLSDAQVHIPFSNFAKSAYVIKLQAKKGSGTYKFINY